MDETLPKLSGALPYVRGNRSRVEAHVDAERGRVGVVAVSAATGQTEDDAMVEATMDGRRSLGNRSPILRFWRPGTD
jgi:hypothetical protein